LYAPKTQRCPAILQGLEKYMMTKLFDRTYSQDPADQERDQLLATRLTALQFVRPENLEIARDFANDGALVLAQKELKKMNMYRVRDLFVLVS
jgi:hypothetical protein